MRLGLLLLSPLTPRDLEYLQSRLEPWYEILEARDPRKGSLLALAPMADAALGEKLPSDVLLAARRLRLMQTRSTSVEQLDLPKLAERGIMVCNSHSSAPYVAEHALAMLLALVKKIALHDRLMREGIWFRPDGTADCRDSMSGSLFGKTVGLVGFGHIGYAVASLLDGFQVRLVANVQDPKRHGSALRRFPGLRFLDLLPMMVESDVVIVAAPLTVKTRNLIGELALRAMGPDALLINVARAEIVDRDALRRALVERWIGGAAIDVWYEAREGWKDLCRLDNVILSPHRAGDHRDFSPHIDDVAVNLIAFARGQTLANQVDCEAGY